MAPGIAWPVEDVVSPVGASPGAPPRPVPMSERGCCAGVAKSAPQLGKVPMGSAGVKVVAVVRGLADAYVHAGGQFQWDNCAPAAVALAAGVTCTRLDGSELSYNEPELSVPDLLVCRPELLTLLRSGLDGIEAREPGAVRPPAERG